MSDAISRHQRRCFIAAAAGGLIRAEWCSAHHINALASLPPDLAAKDVDRPDLVLYKDRTITVVLTPFDESNPDAKVILVGLTPGRSQLHLALTAAAGALRNGPGIDEAIRQAKSTAAFAGPMRTNLIRMLDGIGMHTALDLATCAELFDTRTDLATTTSSVCHAVFVRDGRNYSGAPPVGRHPVLAAFARQVLAANLAMAPKALIIPLGDAATQAVSLAGIDPDRVLYDFPHPSGGNGHRARKYAEAQDRLAGQVARWTP